MSEGHRWKFEPTFNLGHIIMLVGLLGGGISVYVGVFQTLTNLVLRVDALEKSAPAIATATETAAENRANIDQLQSLVSAINDSNGKMLEQLTSIRIDVGVLKARSTERITPDDSRSR